jgi:hypothetical protein
MNQCQKGHTILKNTCKSCREIKARWDNQLESSGFVDIEDGEFFTDHRSAQDLAQRRDFQTQDVFAATCSYYAWARSKLSEGYFTSYRDQRIWELHSEGLSRRKISPIVGLEGSWITRKIHKIEEYLQTGSVCSMSCQLALF